MIAHFSIYKKLTLILLLTVVLPFLICSYWLFTLQGKLLDHFLLLSAQREIVQMTERMNFEFNQVQNVSNLIYLNGELTDILLSDLPRPQKNERLNQLARISSAGTSSLFLRILLVDQAGNTYGTALQLSRYPLLDISQKAWNKRLDTQYTSTVWTSDPQLDAIFSNADLPGVYLIRALHDPATHQRAGMLIIGLPEKEISKKYMGYLSDYQNGYVLEEEGAVISEAVNQAMPTLALKLDKYSDVYLSSASSARQMIAYGTIRVNQWKFLVLSDYASMTKPFSRQLVLFAAVLAIFFGLIVSLMYVFTRRLVKPIKTLHDGMLRAGSGNLSVRLPAQSGDEIGELTMQFNGMLERIQRLMEEVVAEQSKKRLAEIQALQAQIHPHFLYNALASVRYLVLSGAHQKADQALLALVQILKSMLGDLRESIPLEQELCLLKDYIHLQQLMFSSPFEVQEDIQQEAKSACIPKMLLQPLVENAILHGLKPSCNPQPKLSFTAWQQEEKLMIQIADNGVGFTPGQPADNIKMHTLVRSGVGLRNVQERIVHTYGEGYGLSIYSTPGSGTKVKVVLPLIKKEEPYVAYIDPSGAL